VALRCPLKRNAQVSKATAELDEQLQAWRERPLGRMRYLYLDARYEKVRQDGQVRNSAVLLAVGVNEEGKREVLGVSVSLGVIFCRAMKRNL
jgi:putative transposase